MRAHAIIQARYGATRLPGKVLLEVLGKSILEHETDRVRKAGTVEGIIIATTAQKDDLPIAETAQRLGFKVYRGSEEDVLDRYYKAASFFKIEHIVRITADCPLIDPDIIDQVVKRYFESGADYCANTFRETYPDGQDVEVFSFKTLKTAWENANLASEREHVTPYIRKHADKFKLVSVDNPIDLSRKRWTLDEKADFTFIKTVFEALYPEDPDFHMEDVIRFLSDNPEVEDINGDIMRNEGYKRSIENDKKTGSEYEG